MVLSDWTPNVALMGNRAARRTVAAGGKSMGAGELAKLSAARKTAAGSAETVTPPSVEAVRRAIAAGTCPFCGSGPWKMLPVHTNKRHGVDKWQLRDMAELTTADRLCDPATLEKQRAAALRHPEAVLRATAASRAPGAKRNPRQTKAGQAKKRDNFTRWAAENPDDAARLWAGFRDRVTTPEVLAKWRASMGPVWAGREWTNEDRAAFRERMASPEITAKREAVREATRTVTCTEPGCEKPHIARGLCHSHWAKQRRKQLRPRRTQCTVCAGHMESASPRRKYCSEACKRRALRASA